MPRITIDVIYQELQTIKATIAEHTETDNANFRELKQILEGSDSTPGMKIRVDRLEQTDNARKHHLNYVWSAIATIASAFVLKLWLG